MKCHITRLFAGIFTLAVINPVVPALGGSGSWNRTGSMNYTRLYNTATLLGDGQVLVAGGGESSATAGSAELYDPATGKWTVTGTMITPRFSHQAVLLEDG